MTTKTSNNFSGIAAFYLYKFPGNFQMHTVSFSSSTARLLSIAPTCYGTAATFQSRWLNYNGGFSYSHVMDQLSRPSVPSEKQKLLVRGHVQKESSWVQVLLLSPHTSSPETSHDLVHPAMEGRSNLISIQEKRVLFHCSQILCKYSNYSCYNDK